MTGFLQLASEEIEQVFQRFSTQNPHPETELHYTSPFTLLIAVVLSAQATDKGVNKATGPLFKVANTPEKILALGEEGLTSYIKTIGLYRAKARNIMALCEKILVDFNGKVPSTREDLETLPGVGRKTANVILNVAYGHPTIAVDTHIFRVANRIGLACGKTPLDVERQLTERIPPSWQLHAHHWLILHGRYTCKARTPLCAVCLIKDLCRYPAKTA